MERVGRKRSIAARVHTLLASITLICAALAQGESEARECQRCEAAPELTPYIEFLETAASDPIDYVLDLFQSHDLVILCERWHPEITQYDFIRDLVIDPRFADLSGVVFTELGARNLQPALDELMRTPGLDRDAVADRLVPLFRDLSLHPFWTSTNLFEFLLAVYEVNQSRPSERRIEVRFSDLPIDWDTMTAESYQQYMKNEVTRRDRAIADAILAGLADLEGRHDRPAKALAILNYRHAFNDFQFADGSRGDNAGRYLFEALPGRVANVMLNSVALLPGTTDRDAVVAPMQDGKWDAAFRAAGIEEAGFDFRGSPFGADRFDYFAFRPHTVSYEDVFDGFVFYRPLAELRLKSGIPGMFADGFEEEAMRRLEVTGRPISRSDMAELVEASSEPVIEPLDDLERLEAAIARWLEEDPVSPP